MDERTFEIGKKVGTGRATRAEIDEWQAFMNRADDAPVKAGELWRSKVSHELVRIITASNRYGDVIMGCLGDHAGATNDMTYGTFIRTYEHVDAAAASSREGR